MFFEPESKASLESGTNRQDTSASSAPESRLFLKRRPLETNSTLEDLDYLRNSPRGPPPASRLDHLRSRSALQETQITPSLAARAVREFILPMFEADARNASGKTRAQSLGKRAVLEGLPPLEAISGTVYGELKLSDQLSRQLEEVRVTLRGKETELGEALQGRESAVSQAVRLEKDLSKALTDLQLLHSQYNLMAQHQDRLELRFSAVNSQLTEYKQLYVQCEAEKKQLASQLHEEKALNDKLKNKSVELEHGNALLRMENEIIGERLKGLYEATRQVAAQEVLELKLRMEVENCAKACYVLTEFDTDVTIRMAHALAERDQYRTEFLEMSRLRQDVKEERDIIALSSKERISLLQEALTKSGEEVATLKIDLEKSEKLYKGIEDELTKVRQKIKQNRLMRKQRGEADEKVCRKCQKVFLDEDNFHWSCRTHQGEYSGERWWCCGKTSKEAPGCLVSMHESKEDEEDDSHTKEASERIRVANMRCPSCKEIGHRPTECPKDPNIRSRKDLFEELQRIHTIRDKKKQELKGSDLQFNMVAALSEHSRALGLGIDTSSDASSSVSHLSKSRSIAGEKDFFGDVMRLKRGLTFDETETRIKVDDTEEIEEVKKEKRRTRPPTMPKRTPTATVLPALEVAHTQDTSQRKMTEGTKSPDYDRDSDSITKL